MAEALLGGLQHDGSSFMVSEPFAERRQYMAEKYKVAVTENNADVCENSDIVVIAVKPQVLEAVLMDIAAQTATRPEVGRPLFISIVAGQPLATFARHLRHLPQARVARTMPNTPALVGAGATAYVLNDACTAEDAKTVERVMGACGIVERVSKEELLDAVTGLSGSGPAYVYMLIEAMSDGGVRMGLPRATATRLAAQTVYGAGKMVAEGTKHPGELKDAVTSPGGTTIAGVHALETGAFRGTVINAVHAAATRSTELGKL